LHPHIISATTIALKTDPKVDPRMATAEAYGFFAQSLSPSPECPVMLDSIDAIFSVDDLRTAKPVAYASPFEMIYVLLGMGWLACHGIDRIYLPPIASTDMAKLPERSVSFDCAVAGTSAPRSYPVGSFATVLFLRRLLGRMGIACIYYATEQDSQ
jgi:hypothetical protein